MSGTAGLKSLGRTIATAAVLTFGLGGAAVAQTAEEMIAAADPEAGMELFSRCMACHTVEEGGPNRVGPNLWGIVGKDVASAEGFSYSGAMSEFGDAWTPERLFEFLADPRGTVPGTRMAFPGLPDEADRAALIAYLQTQSDEAD